MSRHDTMGITELETELRRLQSRYDDLQETITFNLTHTSAHIGSGEVRQDEETLKDLREEIVLLEQRLASFNDARPVDNNSIETAVIEHSFEGESLLIERFERLLPVTNMEYQPESNPGCEACPKYGSNFACPPHSPSFVDYVGKSAKANIICYRMALEQVAAGVTTDRHKVAHRILRKILYEELLAHRGKGGVVAGSGPCQVCDECPLQKGAPECRTPHLMIYSLESMGVNLISLSEKAFSLPLEWSDGTSICGNVSAIGAVFC
jgi:predicted metal-binding protein